MKSSVSAGATSPVAIVLLLLLSAISVSAFPSSLLPKNISSSPWDAFRNLSGCHVGDHVTGLADLKRYLKRFGYLDFPDTVTNVTDDFDDSLKSALKTYQQHFNLDPSGALDLSTVQQIVLPRCGVPDIINGSTSMNSSSTAHSSGRRLYSFFPGQPRWPSSKQRLTYAFSTENQVVDAATMSSIFSRAFERWAAVTPLTFEESASYATADIRIGFYSGDHGDGEAFDGVLGTLAHAFSPTSGRFHLDAAENWVTDSSLLSATGIDLESVAVHEIGHLLGLGHSSVEGAIMFPTISSGTRRVALAQDDINGVQLLYGSNPNNNSSSSNSTTSTQEEREGAANGGARAVALGFSAAVAVVASLLLELV